MKSREVETVRTIGLDISKNVFQVHGVDAEGQVVLKRQLRWAEVVRFFAELPMSLVGIEACAGAHAWARELIELGHDVRLMPPSYVKPYVRRQKTDAADAAAICEAVTRPSMRFVPVKSEAHQALLLQHRTRDLLVRQMTQTVNAIRAHLAEFGVVAPLGVQNIDQLLETAAQSVPDHAMEAIDVLARQFSETRARVDEITRHHAADRAGSERRCDSAAADIDPGRWRDHRQRDHGNDSGRDTIPHSARLRGVDGPDPEATFQRWPRADWRHFEDGRPISAKASVSRCVGAHPPAASARRR